MCHIWAAAAGPLEIQASLMHKPATGAFGVAPDTGNGPYGLKRTVEVRCVFDIKAAESVGIRPRFLNM